MNMSEEDFRQYVVKLNSEFNLEEILDKIDIGLDAFEKLNKFMPRFPGFDLIKELENFYDEKNIEHVRDFIMLGAEFVKSLDNAELSQLDTSTTANIKQEKPEAVTNEADDIKKEVTDSVHLSQVDNNKNNDDSKMEETVSNHLSQVDSLEMIHNNTTPVEEQEVKNLSDTKKKRE